MKKPVCSWRDMEAVRQLLVAADKGDGALSKMKKCLDRSSIDKWRAALDVVTVLEERGSPYGDIDNFQPRHATEIARAFRKREKDRANWTEEMKDEVVGWAERCETENLTVEDLRKELKEDARQRYAAGAEDLPLPDRLTLHPGNFNDVLPKKVQDDSVDLVFTDPPYDEDSLPLYGQLAGHAARLLKPGGSLIAYAPHYALPQLLADMERHLRYWWLLALKHEGASARLPGKWVFVGWKPLVWFVKGGRASNDYVSDLLPSTPPDKELHDWEQGLVEAEYVIGQLTPPGGTVLDPMCGSGTTLHAALSLGRVAVGIEQNPGRANVTRRRLIDAFARSAEPSP
jgi:hypothetical protein